MQVDAGVVRGVAALLVGGRDGLGDGGSVAAGDVACQMKCRTAFSMPGVPSVADEAIWIAAAEAAITSAAADALAPASRAALKTWGAPTTACAAFLSESNGEAMRPPCQMGG